MIFINYRTSDEAQAAGFLKRELSQRFGASNVFHAGTDIGPGVNFEKELLRRVLCSRVVLAVIGPRWLAAPDRSGRPALESEGDWVRREIAEAVAHGIRVVPILVGDTKRLTDAQLPPDIAPLTRFQHLRLRHDNQTHDLARISDELARLVDVPGPAASSPGSVHMTAKARGKGRIFQTTGKQVIKG